jgi:hypothetical protein
MVNVKEDEREWLVNVTMRSKRCPCRYYPADYIGCTIQTGEENDCNMDKCPLKIPDKDLSPNASSAPVKKED